LEVPFTKTSQVTLICGSSDLETEQYFSNESSAALFAFLPSISPSSLNIT
jgi:hypothetical protein